MQQLILIILMSLMPPSATTEVSKRSEKGVFEVYYKGQPAGTINATKTVTGKQVIFENQSLVNIRMLTRLEVKYYQKAVFINNILQQAEYTLWVNGHIHKRSEIKRAGDGYQMLLGNDEETIHGDILYTSACLLIDEPRETARVFSELQGNYHQLVQTRAHDYSKKAPDGKVNHYQYRNGQLHWAELDGGLLTFEVKRQI